MRRVLYKTNTENASFGNEQQHALSLPHQACTINPLSPHMVVDIARTTVSTTLLPAPVVVQRLMLH